ncbi:MAG: FecR domain-containing protein [Candidatus Cloacimonadales bacterium]|jgi:hypothetical protein|nr:FecR domain-containing protein [Candidatus Cloacimonadales bacterium]
MKKILLMIIISCFVVLTYAQNIAVIAGMKGKINIVRNSATITAKTGDVLKNNDQVQSEDESFAAIRFVDNGATTKLFPNSIIIINASINGNVLNKSNSIVKGTAKAKVTPKSGNFIVETPNTVASVKGTNFLTTYDNFITTIGIIEGEVEIRNKTSDRSVDAHSNDVIQSDDDGNITEIDNSEYIQDNIDDENEQGQLNDDDDGINSPKGSTGDTGTHIFEIELKNPDGTIKKVRISYE